MALSKKDWWFLGKTLFVSAFLPVALVAVWALCVDWAGPVEDLAPAERARMEDCAMAERTFGASALQKRPECRDLIAPSLSASVVAP